MLYTVMYALHLATAVPMLRGTRSPRTLSSLCERQIHRRLMPGEVGSRAARTLIW